MLNGWALAWSDTFEGISRAVDRPDGQNEDQGESRVRSGVADATPREDEIAERVARDLSGDLSCVGCGYNQRGLSVRALCPECGLPVLATVLGVVDPRAEQLQPIGMPRLVAGGLVLWSGSALLAALFTWASHLVLASGSGAKSWMMLISVGLVGVSGLAAGVFVRPHAGLESKRIWFAMIAIALYVPLGIAHHRVLGTLSSLDQSPFLTTGGLDRQTHLFRLFSIALMVAIILLLRPMARTLAIRSLVIRTGRVDRQSMYSLAAALGVVAIGDSVGLGASFSTDIVHGLLMPISLILIGMGSLLFTIGLGGVFLDTIRLVPVIAHAPVGVEHAFGDQDRMFEE